MVVTPRSGFIPQVDRRVDDPELVTWRPGVKKRGVIGLLPCFFH